MAGNEAYLAYGKGRLRIDLDPKLAEWHVLSPENEPAMPDAANVFRRECLDPIAAQPLNELIKPSDRVTVVTSDGTRPTPNHLLVPWLLELLPCPPENVTVLIGTGSHRANTPEELEAMFGADVLRQVRIVNHSAFDRETHVHLGNTAAGAPLILNRAYAEADKTISLSFIEPHFLAGFSGGPKAVVPGVAAIDTIFSIHSLELVGHPNSAYGLLDGNPLQQAIVDLVALSPPDFTINVTLNHAKQLTGIFAGHYLEAHRAGCHKVRENTMTPVPEAFPWVITTNSGFPLDQNLYQSIKGMAAAALICEKGGEITIASECSDGLPAHGNFGSFLRQHASLEEAEKALWAMPQPMLDQWQVQNLAKYCRDYRISIYSALSADEVSSSKLTPVQDFDAYLREKLAVLGKGARVAVLPEGPLTIPYIAADEVLAVSSLP